MRLAEIAERIRAAGSIIGEHVKPLSVTYSRESAQKLTIHLSLTDFLRVFAGRVAQSMQNVSGYEHMSLVCGGIEFVTLRWVLTPEPTEVLI